jgi:hypothetical protein
LTSPTSKDLRNRRHEHLELEGDKSQLRRSFAPASVGLCSTAFATASYVSLGWTTANIQLRGYLCCVFDHITSSAVQQCCPEINTVLLPS